MEFQALGFSPAQPWLLQVFGGSESVNRRSLSAYEINKKQNATFWQRCGGNKTLYIFSRDVGWSSHSGKQYEDASKS